MKKFLTVLSVMGAASVLAGCSSGMNVKKENFINNIKSFQSEFDKISKTQNSEIVTNALNKYILSVETSENALSTDSANLKEPNNDLFNYQLKDYPDNQADNSKNIFEDISIDDNMYGEFNEDAKIDDPNKEYNLDLDKDEEINNENEMDNEISTLYNLTEDINESCDEFCQLKEQITNAIIETDNLINKLHNKEIDLTKEQRMFIDEQSMQLRNLGQQLSNITAELSIHLSDLGTMFNEDNNDINDFNLKYLIVLNNLVNGNDMLQTSLSSINMINQLFRLRSGFVGNNTERILYGFRKDDEPTIFKDYYKDKNGNWVENSPKIEDSNENSLQQEDDLNETDTNIDNNSNKTIDSFQNKLLETNIDTYNNHFNNLDRFFNTALFDNQFMYGNRGGYPYNMYYGMNPYINNQHTSNTTIDCVDCNKHTEHAEQNETKVETEKPNIQRQKKFKITKNIDTYKDENEPSLKEKFSKIKSFFNFELEK